MLSTPHLFQLHSVQKVILAVCLTVDFWLVECLSQHLSLKPVNVALTLCLLSLPVASPILRNFVGSPVDSRLIPLSKPRSDLYLNLQRP